MHWLCQLRRFSLTHDSRGPIVRFDTLHCTVVSGGPGPGASNPRINNQGGGYIGDAPAHKIGTGIKIPHPASNLKKRELAHAASSAAAAPPHEGGCSRQPQVAVGTAAPRRLLLDCPVLAADSLVYTAAAAAAAAAVQYYGAGFDRTYQGLFSPGPATYSPGDRYIGGQSKRQEGPSFSFGSAPRPCTTAVHGKAPCVSPRHYSQRRTPSFASFAAASARSTKPLPTSAHAATPRSSNSPYSMKA